MKGTNKELERKDALADLRRLTRIIVDNLQEGSSNKLITPREMRLLGSTAIRSIRLYLSTLDDETKRRDRWIARSSQKVDGTESEDQTRSGKD